MVILANQYIFDAVPLIQLVSLDLIIGNTLYVLAKQSRQLRAYKLARYCCEKLQDLYIPSSYQQSIELCSLAVRSKPFQDNEVCAEGEFGSCLNVFLSVICLCRTSLKTWCATAAPPTTPCWTTRAVCAPTASSPSSTPPHLMVRDSQTVCVQRHRRYFMEPVSMWTEVLPLMQFYLEDGISDEEAVSLIDLEVPKMDLSETHMETDGILWSSTQLQLHAALTDELHALNKLFDVTLWTLHAAAFSRPALCPNIVQISLKGTTWLPSVMWQF